jgi:hypothetical protein
MTDREIRRKYTEIGDVDTGKIHRDLWGKTERSMGNRMRDGKSETGNEKYNVNTGRFMGKSMGDRGKIQRVS